jgi:hypothetical protein
MKLFNYFVIINFDIDLRLLPKYQEKVKSQNDIKKQNDENQQPKSDKLKDTKKTNQPTEKVQKGGKNRNDNQDEKKQVTEYNKKIISNDKLLFSVDPTNITPYQSNSKNKEEVISGGNHPIPTTDLSSISASRNSKTGIEIKNRRRNKFLGSFETAIDDLIPRKKIRIHSKNESLLPTGTELCFENSLSENLVWKGAVPIRNIQGNCLERTKLKSEICGILNQYIFPHVHVKKWDMYDLENDGSSGLSVLSNN